MVCLRHWNLFIVPGVCDAVWRAALVSMHRFPYELEAAFVHCGDFWLLAAGGGSHWSMPLERLTRALKDELFT